MPPETFDLPLRIIMETPVPGVAIALQRGATGKTDLVGPVETSAAALAFDLEVTVAGALPDGRPRFLGPFVQGPPAARFVYLNAGAGAGQSGSIWRRRVKVPLAGISWALIEALAAGRRLEAHIAGKARDGGPACASVPILPPGWRVSS